MSPENRQRVIGIVVLVVFIALLIPFLFTSGIKKRQTSHEMVGAESNVQNEVILNRAGDDLAMGVENPGGSPVQQPAAQEPIGGEAVAEIIPQPIPEVIDPPLPVTGSPEKVAVDGAEGGQAGGPAEPSKGVVAEQVPAVQAPAQELSLKEEPAEMQLASSDPVESSKALQTKPVSKAAKQLKKHQPKAKSAAGFWSVQVGSFANYSRAQGLVAKLRSEGLRVYMQKITTSRGPMVRVLVGHEGSRAAAAKLAEQVRLQVNMEGRVVHCQK